MLHPHHQYRTQRKLQRSSFGAVLGFAVFLAAALVVSGIVAAQAENQIQNQGQAHNCAEKLRGGDPTIKSLWGIESSPKYLSAEEYCEDLLSALSGYDGANFFQVCVAEGARHYGDIGYTEANRAAGISHNPVGLTDFCSALNLMRNWEEQKTR